MDVTWWDRPVNFIKGGPTRLGGLDVFYEFDWRQEFGHGRATFPNGTPLSDLVRSDCPDGLAPTLLLTVRDDADERAFDADGRYIVVVNVRRIRSVAPNAARHTSHGGSDAALPLRRAQARWQRTRR